MYVQDLLSPGTNITAEITDKEAKHFMNMCKIFASANLHKKTVDDYFAKISQKHSTSVVERLLSKSSDAVANLEHSTIRMSDSNVGASINSKSNDIKKIEDIISVDVVNKRNKIEMDEILSRSKARIKYEKEITGILSSFSKSNGTKMKLTPFGSATYGFGGTNTNLNFMTTGKFVLFSFKLSDH